MSDFEEIELITLSSNAASISFTSIPQTYKNLQVSCQLRVDATSFPYGTKSNVFINGDTTSTNYNQFGQYIARSGTSSASQGKVRQNTFTIVGAASNSDANLMGYTRLTFNNYSAAFKKTGYYQMTAFKDLNNNGQYSDTGLWNWRNGAAITSLTFTGESGNLLSGSSISIYGMKG